jgi:hypothetical protein
MIVLYESIVPLPVDCVHDYAATYGDDSIFWRSISPNIAFAARGMRLQRWFATATSARRHT